jgi:hypothetical protein
VKYLSETDGLTTGGIDRWMKGHILLLLGEKPEVLWDANFVCSAPLLLQLTLVKGQSGTCVSLFLLL